MELEYAIVGTADLMDSLCEKFGFPKKDIYEVILPSQYTDFANHTRITISNEDFNFLRLSYKDLDFTNISFFELDHDKQEYTLLNTKYASLKLLPKDLK